MSFRFRNSEATEKPAKHPILVQPGRTPCAWVRGLRAFRPMIHVTTLTLETCIVVLQG